MKYHKSKYFRVIFCRLQYYHYHNLLIYLCHRNNNTYDLQCKLFKTYYFAFYIVSSLIPFCFELCFTRRQEIIVNINSNVITNKTVYKIYQYLTFLLRQCFVKFVAISIADLIPSHSITETLFKNLTCYSCKYMYQDSKYTLFCTDDNF